ncbi:T9SS type A sorting domain-containing protein [Agriterribacter sp.]|uniref:T9SS type A sorting domain-containing protein n=1 Tax=Agriterribacter sp. TaxID=2821509 RepID=UPI002B5E238D|nr:T9SS type A sorting domain-containing protein [Agriterribacter sp.]HTN06155.1 T9SS type A sorting domain-containing protein [Agriterribacter sp.]
MNKLFLIKNHPARAGLVTLLFLTLCLFSFKSFATDYYWVGGAGNWSDINHWATTSGGTTKHSIVPSSIDDVYFDANSGLAAGNIVQLPTSGHAYCRNMSWVGVTTTASFRYGGSYWLYISGSMELSSTVAYGIMYMEFTGPGNATFKINGAARVNAAGWYNPFVINKPGGSLTLLDDVPGVLAVTTITLAAGQLNLSGGNHNFGNFAGNNNNIRGVDISNANLTMSGAWDFRGTNKTLTSTNSYINTAQFHSDGLSFPKVDISTGANTMVINNTTFTELAFTNTASLPGSVRIGGSNTIDRLEFKGNGCIRNTGNTINKLIVASGKQALFFGTNTINELLQLNTADCSGLGELIGGEVTATLQFGTAAVVDVKNVFIKSLAATGAIIPINVIGADGQGNAGWSFATPPAGTTMYWVNGAGDWNDKTHWSATSGGAGGYCVPFSADDVIFDANSGFTAGNNTVTTLSNTWCRNMTWTGVPNAPVFNESASYALEVWGSVVLDNTVTMNAELLLRGESAATLTSNNSALGNLNFTIQKTGTDGGLSLVDNLVNLNTYIILNGGKFLLPGRTIQIAGFRSSSGGRTIDITNATITTEMNWVLNGVGRTWIGNAAGSFITSNREFTVDGLTYPKVYLTSAENVFSINNATIGELIFTNTSPLSFARAGFNNTMGTLEFKGAGGLSNGNNVINNLLFAASRNYYVNGNNTINGLFRFNTPACSGLGELRGLNETTGGLNFGPSATTDLANVYLQNMAATGSLAPAVTGADAGGNTGFTITSAAAGDRYWVGGSGDWNDNSHWSLTSNGPGGACVPTVSDDVFFDANSFTAGSSTVTTTGNAYCHNMDWTGALNSPVFNESASFNMEIWGDLVMNPAVSMNTAVQFMGSANSTLTTNGSGSGNFDFTIDKPDGSISLALDDDLINPQTNILIKRGTLNAANRTIVMEGLSDESSPYPTTLNISNATISGTWRYTGTNKTLNAANSVLTMGVFNANGGTYDRVNITTASGSNIGITNTTFNEIVFTQNSAASGARIGAGNTIGRLEFKGGGAITGTGNTIDELIFSPGKIYTLTAGTNTTITGNWYGSGTPCNLTEIVSSGTTANATITKTSGTVDLDYVRIRRITAAGAASPFAAGEHSFDQGNNINWNIAPYNSAAPIVGLGPDIALEESEFPYTLHTDGFFGSPMSEYVWKKDGVAAGTSDQLIVAEPGTYSVDVSFPDGCAVSDAIIISPAAVLPITLSKFHASAQSCNALLNWKVESVENFSHFVVERSSNGVQYEILSRLAYIAGQYNWAYKDTEPGNGKWFYRLRLTDIDGSIEYSKIAAITINCDGKASMQVYPNPVGNIVYINSSKAVKSVQLVSVTGSVVAGYTPSQTHPGIFSMPVSSNITKGIYILQVIAKDGTVQNSKLIKE